VLFVECSMLLSGGALSIATDEGMLALSRIITIRTANSGTAGLSGMLTILSGLSKTINSGSLLLGIGAAG